MWGHPINYPSYIPSQPMLPPPTTSYMVPMPMQFQAPYGYGSYNTYPRGRGERGRGQGRGWGQRNQGGRGRGGSNPQAYNENGRSRSRGGRNIGRGNRGRGNRGRGAHDGKIKDQEWYTPTLGVLIANKGLFQDDELKDYVKVLRRYISYEKKIYYAETQREDLKT